MAQVHDVTRRIEGHRYPRGGCPAPPIVVYFLYVRIVRTAGRGKDVAALVPVEDLELLEEIEDRIDVEKAKNALKEKRGIPWKQLKKELGL